MAGKKPPSDEGRRKKVPKYEEALKALETLESLRQEAINELLEEQTAIDEKLAKLGHATSTGKATAKKTRTESGPRECKVCSFTTDPPHNARRHEAQAEKAPFTDEELFEMEMTKV